MGLGARASLVALVLAGMVSGPAADRAGAAADPHRRTAQVEAGHLLDRARLPAGAVAVDRLPAGSGLQAPAPQPTAHLVVRRRVWLVPAGAGAVGGWLRLHPPAGGFPVGSGSSGDAAGLVATTVRVGFRSPPGIASAVLVEEVGAHRVDGSTVVRMVAQVVWWPSRPAGDLVPDTVRTVTAVGGATGRGATAGWVAETGTPRTVRRLVRLVDTVPVALPGPHSCPAYRRPPIGLTFDDGRGRTVATAVVRRAGCPGVTLTVGRRPPVALVYSRALAAALHRIFRSDFSS
ncbi:MAG TPA: hypothetical protein VHB02_16080 [Acidimicrobiales bacterium]|nr:hypothetical protein [Acidimicrobiales bacterium]